MPYIKADERPRFDDLVEAVANQIDTKGYHQQGCGPGGKRMSKVLEKWQKNVLIKAVEAEIACREAIRLRDEAVAALGKESSIDGEFLVKGRAVKVIHKNVSSAAEWFFVSERNTTVVEELT